MQVTADRWLFFHRVIRIRMLWCGLNMLRFVGVRVVLLLGQIAGFLRCDYNFGGMMTKVSDRVVDITGFAGGFP